MITLKNVTTARFTGPVLTSRAVSACGGTGVYVGTQVSTDQVFKDRVFAQAPMNQVSTHAQPATQNPANRSNPTDKQVPTKRTFALDDVSAPYPRGSSA